MTLVEVANIWPQSTIHQNRDHTEAVSSLLYDHPLLKTMYLQEFFY